MSAQTPPPQPHPPIDHIHQQNGLAQDSPQGPPAGNPPDGQGTPGSARKPKGPSVRRACEACHSGKTRCSETLPCQSCIKRGLAATCAYPDPDQQPQQPGSVTPAPVPPSTHTTTFPAHSTLASALQYATTSAASALQPSGGSGYYEYSTHTFQSKPSPQSKPPPPPPPAASAITNPRPTKRARSLTTEEMTAITRNFTRGDFYIGNNSQPVRIDPRLPVKLTLGEDNVVHFTITEPLNPST